MVKGISRQVIVVQNPEQKLFDQVIFILKESAVGPEGVTDQQLLREANDVLGQHVRKKKKRLCFPGPAWACAGAGVTGLFWFISSMW